MEQEYQKKLVNTLVDSMDALRYGNHDLRRIGEQCGNRLPPASAVQAMFLYELQRQTEIESLFHHQMFQLTRSEDKNVAQDRRLKALEERMARLEKEALDRNIEERLATSKSALSTQQTRLHTCLGRVDGLEDKLAEFEKQLDALRAAQEGSPKSVDALSPSLSPEDASTMKEEIDVLFDDRDGILTMVNEAKDRIAKLEDNLRALTLQVASNRSPTTSSPHVPSVQTATGDLIDLGIPKGRAHVTLMGNRGIRSFSPGKPWAI